MIDNTAAQADIWISMKQYLIGYLSYRLYGHCPLHSKQSLFVPIQLGNCLCHTLLLCTQAVQWPTDLHDNLSYRYANISEELFWNRKPFPLAMDIFLWKKQIFSEFSLSVSTEATLTWRKFKQGMRYFTYVAFCKTWLWLQRKYECNYIWKQMMSAFLCPSIHDRWYKPRPTH